MNKFASQYRWLQSHKKISVFLFAFFISLAASAQVRFSLASDLSVLRSFREDQRFWALGQTVQFHFHFTPKDGAYAWLAYYTNGSFRNDHIAQAKDGGTIPQDIPFTSRTQMRLKHISLGWKHYLLGESLIEKGISLYNYAGFGLILGKIVNTHTVQVDTSLYNMPLFSGAADFKRLTLDLGLGAEKPVGGDVYIYLEARAMIPTTDYPSQYISRNENSPFTGAINAGIRILF